MLGVSPFILMTNENDQGTRRCGIEVAVLIRTHPKCCRPYWYPSANASCRRPTSLAGSSRCSRNVLFRIRKKLSSGCGLAFSRQAVFACLSAHQTADKVNVVIAPVVRQLRPSGQPGDILNLCYL